MAPRLSDARWLYLKVSLFICFLLLVSGLFSPMMTMSKFIFFDSSFSIIGGIFSLMREGHYLIAFIVLLFSVLVPILKIGFLYLLVQILASGSGINDRARTYLKLIHNYGRWAMLDVMVVAVLIVTVKLGAIASIEIHWGLYLFGASVFLIMLLTHQVVKLSES